MGARASSGEASGGDVADRLDVPVLRALPIGDLRELIARLTWTMCDRGEVVADPADSRHSMLIVRRGAIGIHRTSTEGDEVMTSRHVAPALCGLPVTDLNIRSNSQARALANRTVTGRLAPAQFQQFHRVVAASGPAALAALDMLAECLVARNDLIAQLCFDKVRVRAALALLAPTSGGTADGDILTQGEMAAMIGAGLRSANGALCALRSRRLTGYTRGRANYGG